MSNFRKLDDKHSYGASWVTWLSLLEMKNQRNLQVSLVSNSSALVPRISLLVEKYCNFLQVQNVVVESYSVHLSTASLSMQTKRRAWNKCFTNHTLPFPPPSTQRKSSPSFHPLNFRDCMANFIHAPTRNISSDRKSTRIYEMSAANTKRCGLESSVQDRD